MSDSITLLVQCGNCSEIFSVDIIPSESTTSQTDVYSLEKTCKDCGLLQHFEIPISPANDFSVIRGIKPT